jgi:beta-lactamase superfamily II metal-dependent hydrolase
LVIKTLNLNEPDILLILEADALEDNQLIFDFIDYASYNLFVRLLRPDDEISEKDPSMIVLKNFDRNRKFTEGTYYKLNKKWIKNRELSIDFFANSSVIRYSIDLGQEQISDFFSGTTKVNGKGGDFFFLSNNIFNAASISSKELKNAIQPFIEKNKLQEINELIVRKVGQGNWNEFLVEKKPVWIYDIGTIYTTSKTDVRNMIQSREKEYQLSRPIVLLSHWHVDHYHMLLEAADETIKALSLFLCRNDSPNQTTNRLINRIETLNKEAVVRIDFELMIKDQPKRLAKVETGIPQIGIYNAIENKSRNCSGILMTFQNLKSTVVCAADFDYQQINKYVLTFFNDKYDNHYLVVPHHGGNAGKVLYDLKKGKRGTAIISVGDNPYRHPKKENLKALSELRFKIIRLDDPKQDNYHIAL